MDETKGEKKLAPPYVPYRTFETVIQRLGSTGIPTKIDRSFLSSFSGSAQAQIFTALRYLTFIDLHGNPTAQLEKLVRSKELEKQAILKEILTTSYPFLFKQEVDLSKITADHIKKLFEGAGTTGDTTRKSIKFFMMIAKDAGIKLSPYLKKLRIRGPRKILNKSKRTEDAKNIQQRQDEGISADSIPNKTLQDLLLSKFPTLDPSWSDEVKSKWFDSFNKLMDELKKRDE
jgi:hypothetical protein